MTAALRISADAYAALGWATLPISRQTRAPLCSNGVYGASVGSGWVSSTLDTNIAVSIGPTGCFVIDEDVRSGGTSSMDLLFAEFGEFPKTPLARTARSGRHWWFRLPPSSRLRGKLANGVDCLSAGRYAIVSPSVTENGRYMWLVNPWTTEVATAPAWLLDRLLVRAEPFAQHSVACDRVRSDDAFQAAEIWLKNAPKAVAGANGSATTMRVVSTLVRYFELGADDAYAVLGDWNASCEPPWNERDLRRKISQAERYSTFRPTQTFAQRHNTTH